jgi:hypothetical protein
MKNARAINDACCIVLIIAKDSVYLGFGVKLKNFWSQSCGHSGEVHCFVDTVEFCTKRAATVTSHGIASVSDAQASTSPNTCPIGGKERTLKTPDRVASINFVKDWLIRHVFRIRQNI